MKYKKKPFTSLYAKLSRNLVLSKVHNLSRFFELMTPPKKVVSTNIGQNIAVTLQF